ncbi:MAG: ADP-ribosylglycohydrolase family protein [Anaerolineales bacterium]|nr:ADP-ribosylglycohydrolase family protein [Anaerolineales bacterium]
MLRGNLKSNRTKEGDTLERSRLRGALIGLAVADALGTTLEFKRPGTFKPIEDMVGGGPFKLEPGQWTDDTSMALCLAASLVETGGFDPKDQMERYLRWWHEGYMSSTGSCFDIGGTVGTALSTFTRTGDPFSGPTDPQSAGNGSLMRLAPVPMFFAADAGKAISRAADSSRTTHGTAEAVDACRYFAGLIIGAIQGRLKNELLSENFSPVPLLWRTEPLAPAIADIAAGSFKEKEPPEIKGGGYVVHCLEAALWAFNKSEDFRSGALMAVNLGDDADTTGAVYGQIAGAFYGEEGIPLEWREKLALLDVLLNLANGLYRNPRKDYG